MTTINLLPWRDEEIEIKNKIFYLQMIAAAVCAIILMITVHFIISIISSYKERANIELINEIKKTQDKVVIVEAMEKEKDSILQKRHVIENMLERRNAFADFVQELARVTMEGLYFESLDKKKLVITIHGVSDESSKITTLIQNIEKLSNIEKVDLAKGGITKAGPGEYKFDLEILLVNP